MGRFVSLTGSPEMIFSSPCIFLVLVLFQRLRFAFRFLGDIAPKLKYRCFHHLWLRLPNPLSSQIQPPTATTVAMPPTCIFRFQKDIVFRSACISDILLECCWLSAFVVPFVVHLLTLVFSKCKDIELCFNNFNHVLLFPSMHRYPSIRKSADSEM